MKDDPLKPDDLRKPGPPSGEELPSYFEEPEPEPLWKRVIASRKFKVSLVIAALAGIGFLAGPKVFREIKARRALAILDGAEKAMMSGNPAEALEKMRAGFSMAPGEPRVQRILSRYKAESGDKESLDLLAAWLDDGSATPAERLSLAGIAIKMNNLTLAMRALDSLPKRLPPELEACRILARANLLADAGRLDESVQILREARLPSDRMRRIRLVLGTLLLSSSPKNGAEGRKMLEELGAGDSIEGLSALRQLAGRQIAGKIEGWKPDRLFVHPLHNYPDVLLASQVRMGERGADRAKIAGDLVGSSMGLDLESRCTLGRWLVAMSFPERVLEIFSSAELATSEPAILVSANALAAQEKWEDLRNLLNAPHRPPLDESVRQNFLARAADHLGDPDAVNACWQAIRRNLPFSSVEVIREMAPYALKAGRNECARLALELLAERKAASPEDFSRLIQMIPSNASAAEVLAVMDKFLAAYPQIFEVRNDQAYLSLLVGRDLEASRATAAELFRQKPEYLACLSVLALAELRLGHPAEAARLYEGRQIDWSKITPHLRAVRIAVLQANGSSAEADALRATLDAGALRPEERELVGKPGGSSNFSTPAR